MTGSGLARLLRRLRRDAAARPAPAAIPAAAWARPLRTVTFAALACDLAGDDPGRGGLRSVGAVRIRGHRLLLAERFHEVLRPAEAASAREVLLVQGLSHGDDGRAAPAAEALDRLVAFLGDAVLVGHAVAADVAALDAALASHGRAPLSNPAIEVRALHAWWRRRTAPPAPAPPGDAGLAGIAAELGVPRQPDRHAFYDAVTAGLVFLKVLAEVEASGVVQLRGLHRIAKP
jgi:DNA polymerase-3 subunit epsilon